MFRRHPARFFPSFSLLLPSHACHPGLILRCCCVMYLSLQASHSSHRPPPALRRATRLRVQAHCPPLPPSGNASSSRMPPPPLPSTLQPSHAEPLRPNRGQKGTSRRMRRTSTDTGSLPHVPSASRVRRPRQRRQRSGSGSQKTGTALSSRHM